MRRSMLCFISLSTALVAGEPLDGLAEALSSDDVAALGLLQMKAGSENLPSLEDIVDLNHDPNEVYISPERHGNQDLEEQPDVDFSPEGRNGMNNAKGFHSRGAVDNNNNLYGSNATTNGAMDLSQIVTKTWHKLADGFEQVALNNRHSDLCGVSVKKTVLCRAARFGWYDLPAIPGQPKYIAMNDKYVVALNDQGKAFRWTLRLPKTRGWLALSTKNRKGKEVSLTQLAMNNQNLLCGVTAQKHLYCQRGFKKRWTRVHTEGDAAGVALNERDLFIASYDPEDKKQIVLYSPRADRLRSKPKWAVVHGSEDLASITVNNKPSISTHLMCGVHEKNFFRCTETWRRNRRPKWYKIGGNYKAMYVTSNDQYLLVLTGLKHVYIRFA